MAKSSGKPHAASLKQHRKGVPDKAEGHVCDTYQRPGFKHFPQRKLVSPARHHLLTLLELEGVPGSPQARAACDTHNTRQDPASDSSPLLYHVSAAVSREGREGRHTAHEPEAAAQHGAEEHAHHYSPVHTRALSQPLGGSRGCS